MIMAKVITMTNLDGDDNNGHENKNGDGRGDNVPTTLRTK